MKRWLVCVVVAGSLWGCGSTEADWQRANAAGSLTAYQAFLDRHPNGPHADEARNHILVMQDDQVWLQAQNVNTPESYQQYLLKEPNGKRARQANERITGFVRGAAWKDAQSNGSAAVLEAFLQKYPQGPEADDARAMLQKLTSEEHYRVQLATFRDKTKADRARARLQARYGTLLHAVVITSAPNHSMRVASGPMSHAEARTACSTLRRSGQHCEIIRL
jgi:cell division protein FtsN